VSRTIVYESRYPDFAWLSADEVAEAGLCDVAKGRAVCIPGLLYKSLATMSGVTPRGLVRRISGMAMRLGASQA
jgi:short-subunit dehydrogenase